MTGQDGRDSSTNAMSLQPGNRKTYANLATYVRDCNYYLLTNTTGHTYILTIRFIISIAWLSTTCHKKQTVFRTKF